MPKRRHLCWSATSRRCPAGAGTVQQPRTSLSSYHRQSDHDLAVCKRENLQASAAACQLHPHNGICTACTQHVRQSEQHHCTSSQGAVCVTLMAKDVHPGNCCGWRYRSTQPRAGARVYQPSARAPRRPIPMSTARPVRCFTSCSARSGRAPGTAAQSRHA